jgi:hypothetical protein
MLSHVLFACLSYRLLNFVFRCGFAVDADSKESQANTRGATDLD